MNHRIDVTPRGTKFDWSCSCGQRAQSPLSTRGAAEADALRHTPSTNRVERHYH